MVLSIVSCNCDEGAWLFVPVLVLLAPLGFSAVTSLFFISLLGANFPLSILPHRF